MITIVIPTYNRAYIISRSLDSVQKQTFANWECIVVDDHSTDDTKEVVDQYIQKDKRFRYIVNSRTKGAQGARNTGILDAKGEWVVMLDSDDYIFPTYLEKVADVARHTDAKVICCYGQIIEEDTGQKMEMLDRFHSGNIYRDLLNSRAYVTFQCTTTTTTLKKIGLLDEQCPSHQELETHIRLSKENLYAVIPEVLWHYYVGRADTISVNREKHVAGQIYIMRKHVWAYRQYAYRKFVARARLLWESLEELPKIRNKYRMQLLAIVPEVILLLLKRKLLKLCKSPK